MLIPLSRSKITVPQRRRQILSRKRLLDILHAPPEWRLMLVSAPPGYGKTSLLVDWAHSIDLPVAWLWTDTLDRAPRQFMAGLMAALAQRFPEACAGSRAMLESTRDDDLDPVRLAASLAAEMDGQIRDEFVLVVDEYHWVDDVPAVREFLASLLARSGDNFHLVLISRNAIELPGLPRLLAGEQVDMLEASDLAFRPEEIRDLFTRNYGQQIGPAAAEELARVSEGWITGLLLSGLAAAGDRISSLRAARASGIGLFDYLGEQVLARQEPTLRQFLLRSAALGEFDLALCAEALELDRGTCSRMIENVKRANLFIQPCSADGTWLRYHTLFQDFLRSHLEAESPGETRRLRERVARVFASRGDWDRAYALLSQYNDPQALAGLITQAGSQLLLRGRLNTLQSWLSSLPGHVLQNDAALLSLQGGVDCMTGRVHEGLRLLEQACRIFTRKGDVDGLAQARLRHATGLRFLGEYQPCLEECEQVLLLASENGNAVMCAEAERIKGLCLFRLGQAAQAAEWLERSHQHYEQLDETRSLPILLMEMGMAQRALGELERAEGYYRRALAIWEREGNTGWQATLHNNLAGLLLVRGQYEQALASIQRGLECARSSGDLRMQAFLVASHAEVCAEVGAFEEAGEAAQRAIDIADRLGERFLSFHVRLTLAGMERDRGDLPAAEAWLAQAEGLCQDPASHLQNGLLHRERGRILMTRDLPVEAASELQAAIEHFEAGGQLIEQAVCQLWLAGACSQIGDGARAVSALRALFEGGGREAAAHSLQIAARPLQGCLATLQGDPRTGRELRSLLRLADNLAARQAAARSWLRRSEPGRETTGFHLHVRGFGRPQVRVNGRLIGMPDWQTQSVRDLFLYLIGRRQPLTREQIAMIFWEDISPQQLKIKFRNEIYRLRRALTDDAVIFADGLYRFNRELDYEYDVEDFERHLSQAGSSRSREERITALRAAVDLVTGPYLEGVDALWAVQERQRLEQTYLDSLLTLGRLYLEDGDLRPALDICERALVWDPAFEPAHRLGMQIHHALGNRAAMHRQYNACRETLETEMGLPPSPETDMLYRKLAT